MAGWGDHRDLRSSVLGEVVLDEIVLEPGAGAENSQRPLFALLLLGAKRCYALEPSGILSPQRQARAFADVASWLSLTADRFQLAVRPPDPDVVTRRARTFPIAEYANGQLEADERLVFLEAAAESTGLLDQEIDRSVSTSSNRPSRAAGSRF